MINLSEENKKEVLAVFAKNMTSYRKAMKVSQEEFGDLIGITRQTVSSIERGAYNLTWPVFLASLFVFSGNAQSRQLITNSFAGDGLLSAFIKEVMPGSSSKASHEPTEAARQIEYASCVINVFEDNIITEADSKFAELTGADIKKPGNFLDYVSEDDKFIVSGILSEKVKKQMYVSLEFKLAGTDGEPVSVSCIIRRQKKLMKDGLFDVIIMPLSGEVLHNHSVSGMIEVIPVGTVVYECRPDEEDSTELYYANDAFYSVIGHTREQFANIHNNDFREIVASDDLRRVKSIYSLTEEGQSQQKDVRVNSFEGDAVWVHINAKVVYATEQTYMIALVLTDITNRINHELNIKYQLDRYRQLDEVLEDIQFNYEVTEDKFSIPVKFGKFVNGDNVIKHFIAESKSKNYVHPEDLHIYQEQWSKALAHGGKSTCEYRIKLEGDTYNWCRVILNCVAGDDGAISYVYGRILIIDEEKRIRKEHKDDKLLINRLSSTDRLTHLYNRTAFRGRVQDVLKDKDMESVHAIIYMDIDNFSFVNEKFGYPAGDKMLREFGQIFLRKGKKCFGCRFHSDFFIVYMNDSDRKEVLTKINNWCKLFVEHQSKSYPGIDLRISTGVYFITSPNADVMQAMNNANVARKQIKDNKLKNICVYTETLKQRRLYEQAIVGGIDDAIKNDRIDVFVQPKFSLEKRQVIGAEALARWREDDGSYKEADKFIPILEASGKIMDLDFCVYTKVLQTLKKWRRNGMDMIPISVNFSDRHNSYMNFDDSIYRLAEQYGVDSKYIGIEVKENTLASDVDGIIDRVSNLRRRGFKIALDGYGFGGSSLGFLLSAPVDTVKIDKAIWRNVNGEDHEKNFVKALASLADAAGKDVVFEGVETEEQAELLKEIGYETAQGYLFAKPMKIEEFETAFLKK